MNSEKMQQFLHTNRIYRILSLDGGGAKGFYTLGVLKEIEALIKRPLCERFDLVFGTSTGAIIAALIALGYRIDTIHNLYKEYVPTIMRQKSAKAKSDALTKLATFVFGNTKFDDVKTSVGIITTRWLEERPLIFKGNVAQAHGRQSTFTPGLGVLIADAIEASCSAYPIFSRKKVFTSSGDQIELIDGGYCANNPTLYAIADAVNALKLQHADLRVVSVGVGVYPKPKQKFSLKNNWFTRKYILDADLLQKTLEINTQSMDQLRIISYKDVPTIRINETFERPEMATDFLEYNLEKLNILRQRGSDSYAKEEQKLMEFLL